MSICTCTRVVCHVKLDPRDACNVYKLTCFQSVLVRHFRSATFSTFLLSSASTTLVFRNFLTLMTNLIQQNPSWNIKAITAPAKHRRQKLFALLRYKKR